MENQTHSINVIRNLAMRSKLLQTLQRPNEPPSHSETTRQIPCDQDQALKHLLDKRFKLTLETK